MAKDQPQYRPLLPKLDILAVDPDEGTARTGVGFKRRSGAKKRKRVDGLVVPSEPNASTTHSTGREPTREQDGPEGVVMEVQRAESIGHATVYDRKRHERVLRV